MCERQWVYVSEFKREKKRERERKRGGRERERGGWKERFDFVLKIIKPSKTLWEMHMRKEGKSRKAKEIPVKSRRRF